MTNNDSQHSVSEIPSGNSADAAIGRLVRLRPYYRQVNGIENAVCTHSEDYCCGEMMKRDGAVFHCGLCSRVTLKLTKFEINGGKNVNKP
jgi:hypothetical protein